MNDFPTVSHGFWRHARVLLAAGAVFAGAYGSHAIAEPKVHSVVIEGMKFTPEVLEVSAGDSVVWTNKDMFPHNVVADDGSFRSVDIEAGKSWRYEVGKQGAFPYICSLHPTMKARLVVK